MVDVLLANGATKTLRNADGKTPQDLVRHVPRSPGAFLHTQPQSFSTGPPAMLVHRTPPSLTRLAHVSRSLCPQAKFWGHEALAVQLAGPVPSAAPVAGAAQTLTPPPPSSANVINFFAGSSLNRYADNAVSATAASLSLTRSLMWAPGTDWQPVQ